MKKSSIKYPLYFLVFTIVAACFFVPLPYYIERPGATIELKDLITVNEKKDELPGSFSLTSVGIQQASIYTAVRAKLNPFQELISEKKFFGGATGEEYTRIQNYYMETSQNNAIEQALKAANRPYKMNFKGVYVLGVAENSYFYGKISVADTVTKIDGKHFENTPDLMAYIQGKSIGDRVEVTYLQDGIEKKATEKLIELPSKKAGIGITLIDHTEITSDDKVTFHVENIGGPSAGLMFTLEIYEQLTGKDLRKGKKIAGTGTMNDDGSIGRIGGIDKKIASASQEGVELFFAPDDEIAKEDVHNQSELKSNYQEALDAAKKLGSKMTIVPVKTFEDARTYLEAMNE